MIVNMSESLHDESNAQSGPNNQLADAGWGQSEAAKLVALANATVHWPIAFDWVEANRDPELHVRRLSMLLAQCPRELRAATRPRAPVPRPNESRLRPDGIRRLGAFLRGVRLGAGQSLVDAASDVGIDPVALALLEHAQLRDDEMTTVLLERLAWGFHTTEAHLTSITCGPQPMGAMPTAPSQTDFELLVATLSRDVVGPTHAVSLLSGALAVPRNASERAAVALLDHSIACAPVGIGLSGCTAAPTIRPDRRRRAGYAQVVVAVRDRAARPVADLAVRLTLSDPNDLPGRDPWAVTNEAGVATLVDVWLPDVVRCTDVGLRLPIAV